VSGVNEGCHWFSVSIINSKRGSCIAIIVRMGRGLDRLPLPVAEWSSRGQRSERTGRVLAAGEFPVQPEPVSQVL
jgi:hypothetical protein